jgi:RNase P subunit RPR2
MNPRVRADAYREFFLKSEAGKEFVKEVERLITNNHEEAEKNPELSRDYVQRAKGNRQLLEHITSVTTEIKKGKPIA